MSEQRWEINKVSTPEHIFDKINTEMPQPVGIMLFGADCEFKNQVVEKLQHELREIKVFLGTPSTYELAELIPSSSISLFVLSSMASSDHELRHEAVNVMRRIGAKNIVGIYVKVKAPQPLPGRGFMGRRDLQLMKTAVRELEKNPPTADGLDYLIVVEEQEG